MKYSLEIKVCNEEAKDVRTGLVDFISYAVRGRSVRLFKNYTCREYITTDLDQLYSVINFIDLPIRLKFTLFNHTIDIHKVNCFLKRFPKVDCTVTEDSLTFGKQSGICYDYYPSSVFISFLLFMIVRLPESLNKTSDEIVVDLLGNRFSCFASRKIEQLFTAFYFFYLVYYNHAYLNQANPANGPGRAGMRLFLVHIVIYRKFYMRYKKLINNLINMYPGLAETSFEMYNKVI
ncbi:hypothetical protein LCGC14_1917300, partial [marine sediment metagenome]